jgi:hypothetical protein
MTHTISSYYHLLFLFLFQCVAADPSPPSYVAARLSYRTQAIHRSFGAATQLFMFKRQFVTQLALTSFLGHAMAVSHRAPSNIYFSRSTANILHLAFTPGTSRFRSCS